jgi:hypothetical protein
MKQGLALFLAAFSLAPLSGTSRAADADTCAQYAKLAVQQSDALSALSCFRGFDNNWHLDYQRHYDWCMTATAGDANAKSNYRRMRLGQCQGSG